MNPEHSVPKFRELQSVRPTPTAKVGGWPAGLIIASKWQSADVTMDGCPFAARWIYKVQTTDTGDQDIYDLWVPEEDLQGVAK